MAPERAARRSCLLRPLTPPNSRCRISRAVYLEAIRAARRSSITRTRRVPHEASADQATSAARLARQRSSYTTQATSPQAGPAGVSVYGGWHSVLPHLPVNSPQSSPWARCESRLLQSDASADVRMSGRRRTPAAGRPHVRATHQLIFGRQRPAAPRKRAPHRTARDDA